MAFGLNAGSLLGEAKSETAKWIFLPDRKREKNFYLVFCLSCPKTTGFVFANSS